LAARNMDPPGMTLGRASPRTSRRCFLCFR